MFVQPSDKTYFTTNDHFMRQKFWRFDFGTKSLRYVLIETPFKKGNPVKVKGLKRSNKGKGGY